MSNLLGTGRGRGWGRTSTHIGFEFRNPKRPRKGTRPVAIARVSYNGSSITRVEIPSVITHVTSVTF